MTIALNHLLRRFTPLHNNEQHRSGHPSASTSPSAGSFTQPVNTGIIAYGREHRRSEPAICTTKTCKENTLDIVKELNKVLELYHSAKDEIRFANDSISTIYYHEDITTCQKAVQECLDYYDSLILLLNSESDRKILQENLGHEIEILKRELEALPPEGQDA